MALVSYIDRRNKIKRTILTVGGRVQHDKARVDRRGILPRFPLDGVGVSAEPVGRFVEEDIVVSLL